MIETLWIAGRAPNTVVICIDAYTPHHLSGRAYPMAGEAPIAFNEAYRMVLDIDDALDHYGGPQASTARRRFGKAAQPDGVEKEEMPLDQEMHEQPVKGERATFVVQIQYRQNATWQGQVLWAEKDERKAFRSALELLKLIDSALDEPNTT